MNKREPSNINKQPTLKRLLWVWMILCILLVSGCQNGTRVTETPTATSPTSTPAPTPTPIPLGQPGNPLVWGFVNETHGAPIKAEMLEIANALAAHTGLTVEARNFDTYEDLLDSMTTNETHLAWLHPITYIYAHNRNIADLVFLSNHYGAYFYGSQILANIESGFTIYFDQTSSANAADDATALAQFSGKRPCWIDEQSLSGYIIPASILKKNDIPILDPVITQTHTAAVRALYIKGVCDFAATFSFSGDPRTSSSVLGDLTDARERIPIIWQSSAVIPNLNLSVQAALPQDYRQALITALQDIIKTDTGKSVISAALNYDIQDLRVVDDSIYDPIRAALETLDIHPQTMLGR